MGGRIALCSAQPRSFRAMACLWGELCLRPISRVCWNWWMAASWFSSLWLQSCCSPPLLSLCALACLLTAGLQTRSLRDAQSVTHPRWCRDYRSGGLLNPKPSFLYPDSADELGPSAQTCWCDCTCTPCFCCLSSRNLVRKGLQESFWVGSEFLSIEQRHVWGKSDIAAPALLGGDLPPVTGAVPTPVPSISPPCVPGLCKPPKKPSAIPGTQEIPTWGTRFYIPAFHSCSSLLRPF